MPSVADFWPGTGDPSSVNSLMGMVGTKLMSSAVLSSLPWLISVNLTQTETWKEGISAEEWPLLFDL